METDTVTPDIFLAFSSFTGFRFYMPTKDYGLSLLLTTSPSTLYSFDPVTGTQVLQAFPQSTLTGSPSSRHPQVRYDGCGVERSSTFYT